MLAKIQGRAEQIQGRAPMDFALIYALIVVRTGGTRDRDAGAHVGYLRLEDDRVPV